ncbi:MAG TPA: hypothetical protein VGP72_19060 [Planctomycetota bacterium]|jgi:hypothetical protein
MTPSADRAPAPLTRSALLIHGLALLAAGVSAAFFAAKPISVEALAGLGVAVSAATAFACWSLVLAARALAAGERARVPLAIIVLFLFEVLAVGALLTAVLIWRQSGWYFDLDWTFKIGLPFFGPVAALAALAALGIALLLTRWAERRRRTRGGAPWDGRERWRYGVRRWLACFVLLLVPPLPWALFFYCIYFGGHPLEPRGAVYWALIDHTPLWLGESSAAACAGYNTSYDSFYRRILWSGCVSTERLLSEAHSHTCPYIAVDGLFRRHPLEARQLLEEAEKETSPTIKSDVDRAALLALVRYGSDAQVRKCLHARGELLTGEKTAPILYWGQTWAAGEILSAIWGFGRKELLPEVQMYCNRNSPVRGSAVNSLIGLADSVEVEQTLTRVLNDPDGEFKDCAIQAIECIGDQHLRARVIVGGLKADDPLRLLCNMRPFFCRLPDADKACVVEAVVALLEHQNQVVRAKALMMLTNFLDVKPEAMIRGGYPVYSLDGVKQAAIEWLKKNKLAAATTGGAKP